MYTRKEREARELKRLRTCGTCRWYDGYVHRCEAGMTAGNCLPDGCKAWEADLPAAMRGENSYV